MSVTVAEAQSLVEWINSFDEGECISLKDLSSGTLLVKCMKNVLPDLSVDSGQEWNSILQVLAEYCNCSLDQCISRELLEAGDEEHLARVVVLVLSLSVERKPNEDVIARIMTLPCHHQRDIMFFIEEALAKRKSNALVLGHFTSGVGDVLPALSGRNTPVMLEMDGEEAEGSGCGQIEPVVTPNPTPSRSNYYPPTLSSVPRLRTRVYPLTQSSYYQGLESPAALRWMKKPRPPRGEGGGVTAGDSPPGQPEEVLRLQHRVRVLEKSMLHEQNHSQDLQTVLCQREGELHDLEIELQKTRVMAERAKEIDDVRDELQMTTVVLDRSEKNVQRLTREVEEQRIGAEEEKERKTIEMVNLQNDISQLKELLEKAVSGEVEQRSEVKRLEVSGKTAAIALQAKQKECESLVLANQEYCTAVQELKEQSNSLRKELSDLRRITSDRENTMSDENRSLSFKLDQTQEELKALRDQSKALDMECRESKQQLLVVEAGSNSLLEQYQATVSELETLRTHCKTVEGQLEQAGARGLTLQNKLTEKKEELDGLGQQLLGIQRENEESTGKTVELKQQLRKREEEIEELSRNLLKIEKRSEEMTKRAMELDELMREKGVELDNLGQQYSAMKEEKEEEKEKAQGLEERLKGKEREMKSLGQQLTRIKEEKEVEEDKTTQLKKELSEKEEELDGLNQELAKTKDEKEEEIRVLNKQLNDGKEEYAEKEKIAAEKTKALEGSLEEFRREMKSLTGRCTTESEEFAAMRASLEEDLSRAHSEIAQLRQQLVEMERELEETKGELAEKEEELEKKGRELGEKEEKLEKKGRELGEKEEELEKKGRELGEKEEELEKKGRELGEKEEELEEKGKGLGEEEEKLEKKKSEVDLTRIQMETQNAELQQSLTSELEGLRQANAILEEEKGELKGKNEEVEIVLEVKEQRWLTEREALEKRTLELSFQTEDLKEKIGILKKEEKREKEREEERQTWVAKAIQLEQALKESTEGVARLTEEAAREERDLRKELEKLREELAGERLRQQQEMESLQSMLQLQSEHSLNQLKTEYEKEKERACEAYSSELTELKELNTILQQQTDEVKEENGLLAQKHSELYSALGDTEETKSELEGLAHSYEQLYEREREQRLADREQIRQMRAQQMANDKNSSIETESFRRQMVEERRTTTRLGAENRSLQAQVSFLERKMKDMERVRNTHNSQSQISRPSSTETFTIDHHQPHPLDNTQSSELMATHTSGYNLPTRDSDEASLSDSLFSIPQHQSTAIKSSVQNSLVEQPNSVVPPFNESIYQHQHQHHQHQLLVSDPRYLSSVSTASKMPLHHLNPASQGSTAVYQVPLLVSGSQRHATVVPVNSLQSVAPSLYQDQPHLIRPPSVQMVVHQQQQQQHHLMQNSDTSITTSAPAMHEHATPSYTQPPSSTLNYRLNKAKLFLQEPGTEGRISELRKRNRKVLPHLKSSYAVELQEKKEDPCLLGEQRDRSRARKRALAGGSTTSLRATSSATRTLDETTGRKRTSGHRKLTGDLGPSGSPSSSRRRMSDPSITPVSIRPSRSMIEDDERRKTLVASNYSLRSSSKENEVCSTNELCPEVDEPPLNSTMFDMTFSPPTRGGKSSSAVELPQRLQQRIAKLEKRAKPAQPPPPSAPPKPPSTTTSGRRRVGGKTASNKPHPQTTSKRPVLKTKH